MLGRKKIAPITRQSLLSLLPNGLTTAAPLTHDESYKLYLRQSFKFNIKRRIKPVDEIMVICIKGKCRDNIKKQRPMKASNYTKSHLASKHKGA